MGDPQFIATNEIDGVLAFLLSIDWWDPWLVGLIVFHIAITVAALTTRNHSNFQVLLFLILLLLVYFSENINEIAASKWNLFSRQQYFDSQGMFISLVFSVPILLNCMIMVLELTPSGKLVEFDQLRSPGWAHWLYQSSQLMTKIKTAQLRRELRASKAQKNGAHKALKED